MDNLSGKKVLCFIALPHHNRFLVPIMEALEREGMKIIYFTAAAEGAFEITLNQANLPYRHLLDYAVADTKVRISKALRELRPVLHDKILGNRTLQYVPLVIQDKVTRGAVESYSCIDRMLEVEKPDLVFALHELNPWGKILGYLSHVHRIPYFTLQEGLYYADIHYYRFHTDYSTACLVWGQECREILLKAGCSDDKIFPLGNTHLWDARQQYMESSVVRRTRAELGIGIEKKVVLFMMSHSHYRTFEAQDFLRWMTGRGDIVAVFKWHPVTNKEIVESAMAGLCGAPNIVSVNDFETYALIGASNVCVTVGNSTTGLEALAFGKPLIEVRLPDQPYSYAVRGVAEQAMGFQDIGAKIDAILSHGLSEERMKNVETYLAHNFSYRDGRTMERIVGLVKESVKARSRGEIASLSSSGGTSYPCSIVLPVDDGTPETLLATLMGISSSTPADLFEVILVNCATRKETTDILNSLVGDVRVIQGEPGWSFATACNRAVPEARGKYLVLLKPGFVPDFGWLEGLLQAVEQERDLGVVGGQVLNINGLLWHVGVAFDVNQSPFSIYRLLPPAFIGAARQREFRAVEFPFLVARDLYCRLGGLNQTLLNRFEDIDFCLRLKQAGLRNLYTPQSRMVHQASSWEPSAEHVQNNCIRFYSKWTGALWQDDGVYLREDGLTHDALSALYRELAGRVAYGAQAASATLGLQ